MELSTEGIREFEALVLRHHVRLRVFVRSLGVDADWVDDVSQEACLTAFRQWESFDQSRDFGKWLRGIARNLVRNELRKDARRRRILHEALSELLVDETEEDHGMREWKQVQMTSVRDCVEQLPPKSRQMVSERYGGGWGASELSGHLQMSAAAIRQALVRIRRQLKECIERKLPEAG